MTDTNDRPELSHALRVLWAVRSWEERPLELGSADCAHFCAHIVGQITGKDFDHALAYTPAEGAGVDLRTLIDRASFGMGEKPRKGAPAIGCPVAWEFGEWFGLGVMLPGSQIAVLRHDGKVVGLPVQHAVRWWMVLCPG